MIMEQLWVLGGIGGVIFILTLIAVILFSPPRPAVPSEGVIRIVVRPLADLAPDPAHLYLGDQLARELSALLQRYQRVEASVGEDAARFVLEGSVRKQGPRLTLQLFLTSGGRGMWKGTYDSALKDVPQTEERAIAALAKSMKLVTRPQALAAAKS